MGPLARIHTLSPVSTGKRNGLILGAMVAAGAAIRFATLDVQSFWYDEAISVDLISRDLRGLLSGIPETESTPPLYYLLAWLWTNVFGTGEVGVRSLSAVLGTATIPVAYVIGRELVSERTGLVLAALAAVNPMLVWYSQEARSYALLVLLAALSFLWFARALREPTARALGLWSLFSVLAIGSHYFAALIVLPEAVWLLVSARRSGTASRALAAMAPIAATGLALAPLAIAQNDGRASFIAEEGSLHFRVLRIPKQYLLGFEAPYEVVALAVAVMLALVGVVLLLVRGERDERRGARPGAIVGLSAIAAGVVLSAVGDDYLNTRNVLTAWIPLVLVVAAGFGARRAGAAGLATAAALAAVSLTATVSVAAEPLFQREDWRGVAEAMGPATVPRAVVTSGGALASLDPYLPGLRELPPEPTPVVEVVAFVLPLRETDDYQPIEPPRPPTPMLPSFQPVERVDAETFTLIRYRAPEPVIIIPESVLGTRLDPRSVSVLYQPAAR